MSDTITTEEEIKGWVRAKAENISAIIGDNNGEVCVIKSPEGESLLHIRGYQNDSMELTEEQFERLVEAIRTMFVSVEIFGQE